MARAKKQGPLPFTNWKPSAAEYEEAVKVVHDFIPEDIAGLNDATLKFEYEAQWKQVALSWSNWANERRGKDKEALHRYASEEEARLTLLEWEMRERDFATWKRTWDDAPT